jgi:hypothetical protein
MIRGDYSGVVEAWAAGVEEDVWKRREQERKEESK